MRLTTQTIRKAGRTHRGVQTPFNLEIKNSPATKSWRLNNANGQTFKLRQVRSLLELHDFRSSGFLEF